jgi:hypothetical protein
MKNISKFIFSIITEASLDSRIPNGVVNLENTEHIQVVAEAMYDVCEDENIVNEFVESFVGEGKHPDRQAYNKDGWLVTFPSAQYKQAAIKKGTHYPSDPTHGKGGMNLYYKKRGKQKRQTQQVTTTSEPVQTNQPTQKKAQPVPNPKKSSSDVPRDEEGNPLYSSVTDDDVNDTGPEPEQVADEPEETDTEDPQATNTPTNSTEPVLAEPPKKTPEPAPAPTVPAPPSYTALSVKFATSKGWKSTPYGEYRDETGATAAVVGLSGEVVPIKNVDREEFKIFAEKNPM